MTGFMEEKEMTWRVAFTEENVFNPDYGVRGIPHVVIIDAEGVVRHRGLHPGDPIEDKIEKILLNANKAAGNAGGSRSNSTLRVASNRAFSPASPASSSQERTVSGFSTKRLRTMRGAITSRRVREFRSIHSGISPHFSECGSKAHQVMRSRSSRFVRSVKRSKAGKRGET